MPDATIPFGEWLPDRPDFANPGATEALNVIPSPDGYRPLQDFTVYSNNALVSRAKGAFAAQDPAGNQKVYAGDDNHLYRLDTRSLSEISRTASIYTTAADDVWEFAQFNRRVLATNLADQVQAVSLSGSVSFANLITSANPPRARHISVLRDFVVLGNIIDPTDGTRPERVHWSGIKDEADFAPSATTQSDFQDLDEGGWVQKIIGGADYGLIFQERQIVRMSYQGSPLVFAFDPIDRRRGTPIPGSVIGWGRFTFFISDEGFFVNDGNESIPIGHEKVDREFWDQFDQTYFSRVSSAIDPVNKIVVWLFPGTGSVAGDPNRLFIYNWPIKRWAQATIDLNLIARLSTQGYTLDTLDTVGTDIDDATLFPFSFDSRAWTGGLILLGGFNQSHQLGFLDGANLPATVETSEFQPFAGRRSQVNSVRPLVDDANAQAAVASRARLADSVSYGTAVAINADGECPVRSEGRYHRIRCSLSSSSTTSGLWTHAQGVEVDAVAEGIR